MTTDAKAAGKALEARRIALGLTKSDLCKRWNLTPSAIYRWEHGDAKIPGMVDDALRWIAHERMMRMQETLDHER